MLFFKVMRFIDYYLLSYFLCSFSCYLSEPAGRNTFSIDDYDLLVLPDTSYGKLKTASPKSWVTTPASNPPSRRSSSDLQPDAKCESM
jgi:hypothetical protein